MLPMTDAPGSHAARALHDNAKPTRAAWEASIPLLYPTMAPRRHRRKQPGGGGSEDDDEAVVRDLDALEGASFVAGGVGEVREDDALRRPAAAEAAHIGDRDVLHGDRLLARRRRGHR